MNAMMRIPYDQLTLGKEVGFLNPRLTTGLDAKSLSDLSTSIEKDGLNDELHVWSTEKDGQLYHVILRGQRRHGAIGLLIKGKTARGQEFAEHGVPIKPVAATSLLEAELYAGREIAQSQTISTYELASYMDHLRRTHNLKGKELALKLGRSETWVSRIMAAYNTAGPELRQAWAKGMPDAAAKDIAAIDTPKKQAEAVAEYLEAKASGDRSKVGKARKEIVAKNEPPPRPAKKPAKKPMTAAQTAAHHRRVAAELEEMLNSLRSVQSKNPVIVGMKAMAEWAVGLRTDEKLPTEFHQALKRHEKEDARRPRLGEKVTWKSQANGNWKAKTGVVVEIVDPKVQPKKFRGKNGQDGQKRQHESYVVEVDGKTYWPLVSQLKRVDGRA